MSGHKPTGDRLFADRFRRIWQLIETIAAEPGQFRPELARRFNVSERQMQADLNIIRDDMGLPLLRRQGYRFEAGGLNHQEVCQLALVFELGHRAIGPSARTHLAVRLAELASPHVRPLARALLAGPDRGLLYPMAQSILMGGSVRLRFLKDADDVLRPELLLPYRGVWWVLGESAQHGRCKLVRVDRIESVEAVSVRVERRAAS